MGFNLGFKGLKSLQGDGQDFTSVCHCSFLIFLILNLFDDVLSATVGRDSVVGIATCYGLDGPGIESRWGGARFSAPVQTGPEDHPASYTMDTGSFPGEKRPGSGVDHPSPTSAKFNTLRTGDADLRF